MDTKEESYLATISKSKPIVHFSEHVEHSNSVKLELGKEHTHKEPHFGNAEIIRDVIVGLSDGLTVCHERLTDRYRLRSQPGLRPSKAPALLW
jgi:hypothetical protein